VFGVRSGFSFIKAHGDIIWALLLRELSTRYGRNNIGFLWIIGEPLLFCVAVLILWSFIKPQYEHGIKIIPFLVTGYMPILLVRHILSHGMSAVRANVGLLYHRQITILHLFIARCGLEFIGVTLAFIIVWGMLSLFGQMGGPAQLHLVYAGWIILGVLSFGLALIAGALSQLFESVERFVSVITYILVPLSGTFYMAAWLPPHFREAVLTLPFLHPVEMVRGGLFGEFVPTYFSVSYAVAWAAGLMFVGLILTRFVRVRVEGE
jgi:capsular polysaccharide transport system permease protein